jgi:hypothetical protein
VKKLGNHISLFNYIGKEDVETRMPVRNLRAVSKFWQTALSRYCHAGQGFAEQRAGVTAQRRDGDGNQQKQEVSCESIGIDGMVPSQKEE